MNCWNVNLKFFTFHIRHDSFAFLIKNTPFALLQKGILFHRKVKVGIIISWLEPSLWVASSSICSILDMIWFKYCFESWQREMDFDRRTINKCLIMSKIWLRDPELASALTAYMMNCLLCILNILPTFLENAFITWHRDKWINVFLRVTGNSMDVACPLAMMIYSSRVSLLKAPNKLFMIGKETSHEHKIGTLDEV